MYAYNKNGEEIDNVIISSRTLKEKNQVYSIQSLGTLQDEDKVYYPMSDNTINTVYNKDRLTLSWDGIPTESNEYEIYKNGDFLAKVKGFEYIDYDIKENEEYTYSIVGNKKLPDKEVERRKIEIEDKIGRSLSEEEKRYVFYEPKKVSIIINISNKNVLSDEELEYNSSFKASLSNNDFQPPAGRNIMLRYTTFIPMDYANSPEIMNLLPEEFSKYKYFSGDNRDFDINSDKFRTRLDSYSTFNQNFSPIGVTINPQTGLTIGFDKDKVEIDRDQADAEKDHKIWMEEIGDDWVYHRGSVSSSNPLIPAPAIDAFYYAKVWFSGKGEFYGVHDQAPSHEFYLRYGRRDVTIHQADHIDFMYLFPHYPKLEWQVNID